MDFAQKLRFFEKEWGIVFPGASKELEKRFLGEDGVALAMDAQPALITQSNAGIPAFLTTFIDPDILRVLTARNNAAKVYPERKKGAWTDLTTVFPIIEQTGQVNAYGDYETNGRAGANSNFPQRQSFLYQTIIEWGELEMERAGLAKIQWSTEVREAGVTVLNKFQNLSYFKGISGLQNYGMLNDPGLLPPIAPSLKAWGSPGWFNGNVVAATANEIYSDIQAMYTLLVLQSSGNIDDETPLVLAMSPKASVALTTTNAFNVNVKDLLKKNFPQIEFQTAVQYGAQTTANPDGSAAGEIVQMIAKTVEAQETGFVAFNEKLRAGKIIPDLSSFKQKTTQGTWGWIGRQPFAVSQMLGV